MDTGCKAGQRHFVLLLFFLSFIQIPKIHTVIGHIHAYLCSKSCEMFITTKDSSLCMWTSVSLDKGDIRHFIYKNIYVLGEID